MIIGGSMEKTIFDVNPECTGGITCPKFVIDESTRIVSLIDRQGNRASMTVEEYNGFIKAAKTGAMAELRSLERK
jgi:hypothetical protein